MPLPKQKRLAPPSLIRAALPASLLPDRDGLRVLFLSDRVSALPRVWVTLPYVERIECVWPSGANELEPAGRKVKISRRAPGLGALSGRYDLIFIEGFGPVSPASKRLFVELLQRDYLTAPNGVLVLPRREAASLPPGTIARPLPGAGRLRRRSDPYGRRKASVLPCRGRRLFRRCSFSDL